MVLNIMRSKKFSRRVLAVFAVVFIPAFLFWGVSGSLSGRQPLVGMISGHKITSKTFIESREGMKVQIILGNYTNYSAIQKILQNRELINNMTWERLILLDEAKRKKITISNEDVVNFIASHPLFQKNGVFDKTIYNALLKNTLSLLPRDFEEYVRENLAIQAIRQKIIKDINVSDEEIVDFYNNTFGEINCSYVLIDESLLSEDLAPTDTELKEYYDVHKDSFFDPAQVQIEYIEIPYSNTSENEQARKALTSAYSKIITEGKTLQKIAENAGLTYKKPDIFSAESLIPDVPFFEGFYETAFTLNEGEISPLIYSHPEKGSAYMIRKIKNYPKVYKSFEDMKDDLKEPAKETKRLFLSKQKADELYSEMKQQELTLENLADKYALNIKTSGNIGLDSYIENFGPTEKLISKMKDVSEKETIPSVVSLKGVLIARLDARIPPEEKDFAEKKARIKNLIFAQKQTKALEDWFKSKANTAQLQSNIAEL